MTNDTNYRGKANAVFFAAIMVVSMVAAGFAVAPAAAVNASSGDLTFNDQELVDGEVTISDVTTNNGSGGVADAEATAVVTYTNSTGDEIVAGFADANESDSDDIQVAIEDEGGFPGDHTAWLFADGDVPAGISAGDNATALAGSELASDTALVADESFDVSYDEADLHGDTLVYQGQTVLVKNLSAGSSYTLQEVIDSGDQTTRTRAQLSTDAGENYTTFTTANRNEADYFISGSGSSGSVSNTFELVTQDLSATFDEDEVDNRGSGAETFVEIDSELRSSYPLTVSADGDLSAEELEDIFGESNVESLDTDDDEISLGTVSDGDFDVDFDEIDAGDYEFTFSVDDTTAEDTASVTVNDVGEGELDVDPSSITQEQGDIVPITVTASEAASSGSLVIGDEDDVGYQANVSIDAFGDNDEITIYFNSYAAGNTSVAAGDTVWLDEDDADDDAEISFESANQTTGIDQLDTGDYELAVSTSSSPSDTLETPDNIGSLFLEERSTSESINTWTVSDGVAGDITSADDPVEALNERVGENVTQSSSIANGDRVVHQIEASGLTGLLEATGEDGDASQLATALESDVVTSNGDAGFDGNSLDLRLRETRESAGPNAQLRTVNLSSTTYDVVVDEETNNFYVIVDTDTIEFENTDSIASDEDVEIEARFRVQDARLLNYNRIQETDDDVDSVTDIRETARGTFSVVEAEGSFANDPYNVSNTEGQVVEGTTNLAPGTELTLRVRSSGDTRPAFSEAETVTVANDGSWSTEFDFSEQNVGDEYTMTLRNSLFGTNPSVDGTVVESVEQSANFAVSDLSPQEATATAGDSVDVSATIENTGNAEGTQTVALTLDGDELDSQEVTLADGESTTVEFTADTSGLEAGDYEHGVATDNDEATGTLTIEASGDGSGDDSSGDDSSGDDSSGDDSSGDDSSGDDSTDDGAPGFGALVALVALIAAALIATRRND
ncbi:BGTF surface domain-containing protein [Halorubrum sp. AJ67]|uniref:BGTF surface domain-containing protein n=1 Tax=Halorubrum sp. AJ67 TaxID=1173487 RepID=UPI0003DD9594|nr:BGTF surface domain-containing protein [Halorubrum sp. AJ67]CDK40570.1 putative signal peptide protein [Halorubrum sp. AJ67]